jgi:thiamine biosynthesis protein ThiI
MPVLTQGRVVVLLSGGIDSPVAAWMMMKRGCAIVPIHFYQSEVEKAKVLELIQVLQRYSAGYEIKPIFLPHDEVMGPLTERLREQRMARWTCILCKRAMLHRAAAIASEMGIQAVVTGDSLGQVASQTLENMAALSAGVDSLVLRPLIGHDKVDTVDLARRVGTFDVSTAYAGACPYLPPNVYTQATRDGLQEVVQALEDAGVGTTAGSSPS